MSISFNGDTPIFQKSEFLEQVINGGKHYKSVFLGNAIDMNNHNSDLYLITTHNGQVNGIVQYGEDESHYSSGATFLWQAAINKQNQALYTLYTRAIEAGCLVEKSAVVGYSETKSEEEDEAFFNSDYYQNRPSLMGFYDSIEKLNLSDDEEEKREKEFNQSVDDYDKDFKEKNGYLPSIFEQTKNYQIFDSLEEAQALCDNDDGVYEVVTYTTKEHLVAICNHNNYLVQCLNKKMNKNNPKSLK